MFANAGFSFKTAITYGLASDFNQIIKCLGQINSDFTPIYTLEKANISKQERERV